MEVQSTIYDSKILNQWRTKPCFEIIHDLLVSVFDKVSKPIFFLEKPKLCQNERASHIFLEQLVGEKVVCSCAKLH